jgi:hypothetical protein
MTMGNWTWCGQFVPRVTRWTQSRSEQVKGYPLFRRPQSLAVQLFWLGARLSWHGWVRLAVVTARPSAVMARLDRANNFRTI